MKITKDQNAITLIALVITIIVLLILAGVALATLTGNGSIIDNANYAVEEYDKSATADQDVLNKVENIFAKYMGGSSNPGDDDLPTYTITYNANGGSGTMNAETASTTAISTFTPPTGKQFKEWNTSADGSGTSYAAGATVPSDVTLYAIWESEIEVQYGDVIEDEDEITDEDMFTYQILTEPSVAVVRNTPSQDGVEGIVSRGNTPNVTTQKGTAKITGINWGNFDVITTTTTAEEFVEAGLPAFAVATEAEKNKIESALKKLVIPYEVTLTSTTTNLEGQYTITQVDFTGDQVLFVDYIGNVSYYKPIIATGSNYYNIETAEAVATYLIIPSSVTSVNNLGNLMRDYIVFSPNSTINTISYGMITEDIYDARGVATYCSTGDRLRKIVLPETITRLGDNAFKWCTSLEEIDISTVNELGTGIFENCNSLKRVTLPENLTRIPDYMFSWCEKLDSITIPNSVTSLGEYAFAGCDKLDSITIPNSVTSMGKCVFCSCDALTTITIPNSITSIQECTFDWCRNLETITLPNTITSIGGAAFRNCNKLKTVIYNGVTYKKVQELINALTANNVTLGTYHWTTINNNTNAIIDHYDGSFEGVKLEQDT